MRVPKWVLDIKDEELAIFAWFCDRTCKIYGYDNFYTIHVEDVIKIVNKRNKGLFDWIISHKEFTDWVTLGHIYDDVFTFKVKIWERPKTNQGGRPPVEKLYNYPLSRHRSELIYMYLLGCLNTNFIEDDSHGIQPWKLNSFGIHEFNLDRTAIGYIKKKDRMVDEEASSE